ncbi:uncharacterized protein [Drosophila bipectinata]|uniref:uncharacterized protein n=1 Tax=Drosophila bipectinata TaxID=42026 RepID=UPI001C8A405A|nr:uncharacterized protein LOC108120160 [Drosophila bipectinata]
MEEDLTRDDILELLKKREVYIPNEKNVTLEELEEIYWRFAVPQPQRDPRDRRRLRGKVRIRNVNRNEFPGLGQMEQLTQRIQSVAMLGHKRSLAENTNDNDNQAKQIKIDLPVTPPESS